MKHLKLLSIFALLLFANTLFSQEKKEDCQDVVYLKGGSILRGTISEYKLDGELIMTTWSGAQMRVPATNVKKVIQDCKTDKKGQIPLNLRPYSFKESGWYHATRFGVLSGESGRGFSIQHSSGLNFNRLLSVGMGIGFEKFDPFETEVATFPIFAEMRGYLLPKNISPFYALGLGYGFSKKDTDNGFVDGPVEQWRGGWMAQGHIGYRIGNHATIHLGIRLQHKTFSWENPWGNSSGINRILHKRVDVGLGILL